MRFSKLYAPTLREIPADAEIKSQELLQRGAFVRKIASGIYTFLPLGFKVLKKVEQIVREEMNNIGAQELLMPILQPAELWKQTGRWDDYGPEMMKLKDRHERDFTLGPTHEEMITYIVKNELNSYKQLPISLYQIAPKYRDEIRPRFGVLRAREFIMKDAYSFHESQESLDKTYQDFYNAYKKIMERLGVDYMIVEADTGAIGGNVSHEFHVKAKAGETTIFYCDSCGYAASDEKAESSLEFQTPDEQEKELNLVDTPNVRRIEEVASFLNVEIKKIIKSILYKGVNGWVLALIRGDYEINEAKLKSLLRDQTLELAQPEQVKEKFGVSIGFIGPVGIDDVKVVADFSVKSVKNAVVGGMKEDKHYINANEGRDFKVELWGDIRMINVGEPCPKCGKNLKITKGIELGQVFKLGTKYSDSMQAYYNDEKGERKPFVMGCYGWGISRTLGAVVEQLHDENGILWPLSIAPFEIDVIAVNMKDQNQIETAEKIYKKLKELNYDVLFDDREVSPGVKFKDADLIGIPLKIVVGKALKESKVELKLRYEKEGKKVEITEELKELVDAVEQKLKEYDPRKILKDID